MLRTCQQIGKDFICSCHGSAYFTPCFGKQLVLQCCGCQCGGKVGAGPDSNCGAGMRRRSCQSLVQTRSSRPRCRVQQTTGMPCCKPCAVERNWEREKRCMIHLLLLVSWERVFVTVPLCLMHQVLIKISPIFSCRGLYICIREVSMKWV